MKKKVIAGGVLSLVTVSVQAQWTEAPSSQNEQQQSARLLAEQAAGSRITDNLNRATLIQNGNQNNAQVNQQYSGAFLSGNLVNLQQAGDLNRATLNQSGAGLRTDLTQQGSGNTVRSDMVGNNTTSLIEQNGNGNELNQQLSVSERTYLVQQQGNNNLLEQRESGANAGPGYEVKMVGNGIRITVEQGVGLPKP